MAGDFEWDEVKNRRNVGKHGVDFSLAQRFDWGAAHIVEDDRRDYGETRYIARGFAEDGMAYHVVYTLRGEFVRIISMRPFTRKELERWRTERG